MTISWAGHQSVSRATASCPQCVLIVPSVAQHSFGTVVQLQSATPDSGGPTASGDSGEGSTVRLPLSSLDYKSMLLGLEDLYIMCISEYGMVGDLRLKNRKLAELNLASHGRLWVQAHSDVVSVSVERSDSLFHF